MKEQQEQHPVEYSKGTNSADVLGDLWTQWAGVLQSLTAEEWHAGTRCGEWDVAALSAHVSSGVSGLRALLDDRQIEGAADLTSAALIIRAVKPSPEVAEKLAKRVAEGARDQAAAITAEDAAHTLLGGVDVAARARHNLHQACDYFGRGAATIEASIDLRIVEATVHLLDLAHALDRPLVPSDAAMSITIRFLVDLVPPVEFVEAATGRRSVDFFPVHS